MSLKSLLMPVISQHLLSEQRLRQRRANIESERAKIGLAHEVHYFHQVDDPYSALACNVLPVLNRQFNIQLRVHLVSPPADSAAPAREQLIAYSRRDAECLAKRWRLVFKDPGAQPGPESVAAASSLLTAAIRESCFSLVASRVGECMWNAPHELRNFLDPPAIARPALMDEIRAALAEGDALRARLGHYLGAMFYYGEEWYWGLDRLHHLEHRLRELGAEELPASPVLLPPPTDLDRPIRLNDPPPIDFFLSLRSPYTAIVARRVFELGRLTGAQVRLRPVMPMVMRGLPVPREKQRYIAEDTAREARLRGIAFGRLNDPVGRPVERGMALIDFARERGRGQEFVLAYLEGVWARGIDAGSDRGLRKIVERAGLTWSEARERLGNETWRAEAEQNRQEMSALGLWGVPSFRVGSVSAWGQDRLWVIQEELLRHRHVA